MPWPTPQDYNEAIQNPAAGFWDGELRAGKPALTPLGLPRPITGNFASVYRLHCAGRDWAVRCFFREYADMADRYRAISTHLARAKLPYTVPFEYQEQGIRVRGTWYPILKMQWVEGQLLNSFVERHLGQPRALRDLAARWLQMLAALEAAGIAHGDLQHGNVLVTSAGLKLVDYDGMFVPALSGRISHELGHPNYQHPRRTGQHFSPAIDNFSATVIYLSLLAVGAAPSLWTEVAGGDECLLLRKTDFEVPARSTILARLRALADPRLSALVGRLEQAVHGDPCDVPPVHSGTSATRRRGSRRLSSAMPFTSHRNAPFGGRWSSAFLGHRDGSSAPALHPADPLSVPVLGAAPVLTPAPAPAAAGRSRSVPAWVLDALPSEQPAHFASPPARLRLLLSAVALAGVGSLLVLFLVGVPLAVAGVVGLGADACLLATSFVTDRTVAERRRLIREERTAARRLRALSRELARIEARRERSVERHDNTVLALLTRRGRLEQRKKQERDAIAGIVNARLSAYDAALLQLRRVEAETVAAVLQRLQERHVRRSLRRHRLPMARVPGLPWPARWLLWRRGLRSAADVTERALALNGLPSNQMSAVLRWHVHLSTAARASMPREVPSHIVRPIRTDAQRRRRRLERARRRAADSGSSIERAIDGRYDGRCARLDRQVREASLQQATDLEDLDRREDEIRAEEDLWARRLHEAERSLERFEHIRFPRFLLAMLGQTSSAGPPS